jgi:aminoglycoside phosphotransferase (APT) family kinase protein
VDDLAERLAARLTELWSGPVAVDRLQRLSGGTSRTTWSFDAIRSGGDPFGLILRADTGRTGFSCSLELEASVFRAAAKAGVPVPAVLDGGDDGGPLGCPYLLMERLDGETIPRRLLREERFAAARAGLAAQLGGILARLHSIPADELPGIEVAEAPLDHLRLHFGPEGGVFPPGLEVGMRWLAEHPPEPGPPGVVHGDFRLGNLVLASDGLRGVLDWELVHIGDPQEDFGWLCAKVWRFGGPGEVAGVGHREELLDGYAAVSGWRPTAEQLDWWELFATVRWGAICAMQARRHLSGEEPSVELAAIGRRACEQEFDVLLHLGLAEPEAVADPLDDDTLAPPINAPHAAPDMVELLGSVRQFLSDEVMASAGERTSFHARVAVNVLRMVERQLLLGPGQVVLHQQALERLGCADDTDLSRAIRAGTLDRRWDEVVDVVRAAVRDQLLVANPRHLTSG